MKDIKPNFEDVVNALKVMKAISKVSESHGLLCALLSFDADIRFTAWANALMTRTIQEGDLSAALALKTIKKLYNYTKYQFDEKSLNFDIFIPEDNQPLSYRAKSLTEWIKGFLSGVGLFDLNIENSKDQEVKEAMNDLIQISYMDYNSLEKNENSEYDFMELMEYIKVAVLLIDSQKIVRTQNEY